MFYNVRTSLITFQHYLSSCNFPISCNCWLYAVNLTSIVVLRTTHGLAIVQIDVVWKTLHSRTAGLGHVVALIRCTIVCKDGTKTSAGITPAVIDSGRATCVCCTLVVITSLIIIVQEKLEYYAKSGMVDGIRFKLPQQNKEHTILCPISCPNE